MSTSKKNILLFGILIVLCFMIKCKLDTDKSLDANTSVVSQEQKSQHNEKDKDITQIKTKASTESSIAESEDSISNANITESKDPKDTVLLDKNPTTVSEKVKKKPKKKRKAKIKFEELTWDFGEIIEGDIVKKKFIFKNTGNAPLQILGADASCGCARPTVPFLDIAPGDSNEIGITYNSVNKEGEQHPEIIIESNTYPKHTVLKLSGTVKAKAKRKQEKKLQIDSISSKKDSLNNF